LKECDVRSHRQLQKKNQIKTFCLFIFVFIKVFFCLKTKMKKLEADWLKAPYGASAIIGLLKDQWKLNSKIVVELPEIFYQGPGAIVHDLLNLQLNRNPQEVIQDERMYNLVAFRRVRKKFLRWLMTQSQRFDRFLEVYPTLESQKDLVNNIFLFACEHGEKEGFDSPLIMIQEMCDIIIEKSPPGLLKDTLPLNAGICMAAELGNVKLVKLLGNNGANPGTKNNYPIRWASRYGHAEVVKLLLGAKGVDATTHDNLAIRVASANGHAEVVKLLLGAKGVNPAADNNWAIQLASRNGHLEVVKLLLGAKGVNPAADDNFAIRRASSYGHAEVVKLLLSNPKVVESISLDLLEKIKELFPELKDMCTLIRWSRSRNFNPDDEGEQSQKIIKNKIAV
jgi:ankyrin repeat protein